MVARISCGAMCYRCVFHGRSDTPASYCPGSHWLLLRAKSAYQKREREREREKEGNRVRRLRCKRRVFSSGQTASKTLGDCCRAETNGGAFARNYSARPSRSCSAERLVIIRRTVERAAGERARFLLERIASESSSWSSHIVVCEQ